MKIAVLKRYDINGSWTGDMEFVDVKLADVLNSMWQIDKVIDFKDLYFAADSMVNAINKNQTYLWRPELNDTEMCIMVHRTSFLYDPDDEDTLEEYDGISDQIDELNNALNPKS
jgi:hypothetical protein